MLSEKASQAWLHGIPTAGPSGETPRRPWLKGQQFSEPRVRSPSLDMVVYSFYVFDRHGQYISDPNLLPPLTYNSGMYIQEEMDPSTYLHRAPGQRAPKWQCSTKSLECRGRCKISVWDHLLLKKHGQEAWRTRGQVGDKLLWKWSRTDRESQASFHIEQATTNSTTTRLQLRSSLSW